MVIENDAFDQGVNRKEKELTDPTRIAFVVTTQIPSNKGMGRALGVETLALYLNKTMPKQVNMTFHDLQYEDDPLATVEQIGNNPEVDIIGISVRYGTFQHMKDILSKLSNSERFQQENPPFVVVGGVMPTFKHKEIVEEFPFIGVISGEAELGMRELTKAIRNKSSLYNVPSLTFFDKEKREIVSNTAKNVPMSEISVGEIIPDLLDDLKNKGGIVWVSSSRGCPWDCSFCSVATVREITGAKGKTRRESRPVEDVIGELQALYNNGFKSVVFSDDEMLDASPKDFDRWKKLADGIKKIGDDFSFQFSVRSDVIVNKRDKDGGKARAEAFHSLVEAGLEHVYIGFESGSITQLKRYNKAETPDDHFKAIDFLRKEGVLVGGGFIMFDPLMNLNEILENIDFLRKTDLISPNRKDYIGDVFDLLRAQEGTKYVQMLRNEGLLKEPIPNTLFYEYDFRDPKVRSIAETCIELAAEEDVFFEALKNAVFAKTMAEHTFESGIDPEARLLNNYLISYRLQDLDLLERLVIDAKETEEGAKIIFDTSILQYRNKRKKITNRLVENLTDGSIKDKDTARTLMLLISQLPYYQEDSELTVPPLQVNLFPQTA